MSDDQLNHERLDVYQAAIAFLTLSLRIEESLPSGYRHLGDQLKRAALSIPLNIAEGYGKSSRVERRRFYSIARGSAHECGAILDASRVLKVVDEGSYREGKVLLSRIVSMLVRM